MLDDERSRAEVFQELPFHYLEIAHILLTQTKDTFGDSLHQARPSTRATGRERPLLRRGACCLAQVQDLVESVRKVRFTKVDSGLSILAGPMTVKLNNLSAMECNVIRPFFSGSLDCFYRLARARLVLSRAAEPPWQAVSRHLPVVQVSAPQDRGQLESQEFA